MSIRQQLAEHGVEVRRFEYDDSVTLAADFGRGSDVSVEVVGETAIVLADGEQYDIEVGPDAQAFMNNGVLTIEVNQ